MKVFKKYSPHLLLLLLPIASFWAVALMIYTLKWDVLDQFFPYRYFLSDCYHNGIAPYWQPYQHLGSPFYVDPQSNFWNPIVWFFTVLGGYSIKTVHLEFILYLGLAGNGMFLLLRQYGRSISTALLFALAYQHCGVFVSNAQHLTWVAALAWIPFIMWAFDRLLEQKSYIPSLLLAMFTALMTVSGYPIFLVLTAYLLLFVLIAYFLKKLRRGETLYIGALALRSLVSLAFYFGLTFGYYYSLYNALPHFSRAGGVSLDAALFGPFSPQSSISFIFPFAVKTGKGFFDSDVSMLNSYFGLVPLLFGLSSLFLKLPLKLRAIQLFGILALFAAFGEYTPFREWLYYYVPMMDSFRHPGIFRVFFIIGLLITGAVGFDRWLNKQAGAKRPILISAVFLGLLLVVAWIISLVSSDYFALPHFWSAEGFMKYDAIASISDRIAIQGLIQVVLLALMFGILFFKKVKMKTRIVGMLIISFVDVFASVQLNMYYTIVTDASVSTYNEGVSSMPKGYPIPDTKSVSGHPQYANVLFPGVHSHNTFTKVVTHKGWNSFQLSAFKKLDDSQVLNELVESPVAYFKNSDKQVSIETFQPGRTVISLDLDAGQNLVVLQMNYPGWQVYIDNERSDLELEKEALLSVHVPSSARKVEFLFKPIGMKMCFWMVGVILTLWCFSMLYLHFSVKRF